MSAPDGARLPLTVGGVVEHSSTVAAPGASKAPAKALATGTLANMRGRELSVSPTRPISARTAYPAAPGTQPGQQPKGASDGPDEPGGTAQPTYQM